MKIHASSAIENGLTAQFTNSVTLMPRQCRLTWLSAAKSTLSSIGTIITQMSRPTGRLTWAISMRPTAWNTPGADWPSAMPATMHAATHTLRYRSKPFMTDAAGTDPTVSVFMVSASLTSNIAQPTLQRESIKALQWQRQEKLDAPTQRDRRIHECLALLFLGTFDRGRV